MGWAKGGAPVGFLLAVGLAALLALGGCASRPPSRVQSPSPAPTAQATSPAPTATPSPTGVAGRPTPAATGDPGGQTPAPTPTATPGTTPSAAPPEEDGQPVVERLANGLDFPLALAFLPNGTLLVGEQTGRIQALRPDGLQPLLDVRVDRVTEGGLLGMAVHQEGRGRAYLYTYYTHRGDDGLANRVSRWRIRNGTLAAEEVVLDGLPAGARHNGGAMAFGPDGMLYVTVGDAEQWQRAQDMDSLRGKVLRLEPDGDVPEDNPFDDSPVYALGVRNPFGLAFDPATGLGYFSDNMVDRDDELNLLRAGANYGWPEVVGVAGDGRFTDPLLDFTPTTAPTAVAFLHSQRYPARYQGRLLLGEWNRGAVRAVTLVPPGYDAVAEQEVVLQHRCCIIALAVGPDGLLYYTTADAVYRVRSLPEAVGDPTPRVVESEAS